MNAPSFGVRRRPPRRDRDHRRRAGPHASRPLTLRRTSSRCSRLASAPICTPRLGGSPTTTAASALGHRAGDRVDQGRRHERTPDRRALLAGLDRHLASPAAVTYRVELRACRRPASGPSIEQLSESASALNRTRPADDDRMSPQLPAVAADPVNDTRSCRSGGRAGRQRCRRPAAPSPRAAGRSRRGSARQLRASDRRSGSRA